MAISEIIWWYLLIGIGGYMALVTFISIWARNNNIEFDLDFIKACLFILIWPVATVMIILGILFDSGEDE